MINLVTGGTGFIGAHLVKRLIRSGQRVRCLVRGASNTRAIEEIGAELRYSDITDRLLVSEAMRGVAVVYHSAGMVGEWLSKKDAHSVNVEGTENLLKCALEAGVGRFVYVSSLAVLGMRNHYGTSDDAPHRFTGDPYADTKIKAEKLVMDYCRTRGLPAVIIRPGFVFGPGDSRFLPRMMHLLDEGKFVFLGNGDNIMNLVYIDNLIEAIMEAASRDGAIGHAYNIRNNDQVTMREFVYMIADAKRIERPGKSIPVPLARLAASAMEFFGRLTGRSEAPFITKARIKVASLNLDFDISKAEKELGYSSPVTIREGVKRTLEIGV